MANKKKSDTDVLLRDLDLLVVHSSGRSWHFIIFDEGTNLSITDLLTNGSDSFLNVETFLCTKTSLDILLLSLGHVPTQCVSVNMSN